MTTFLLGHAGLVVDLIIECVWCRLLPEEVRSELSVLEQQLPKPETRKPEAKPVAKEDPSAAAATQSSVTKPTPSLVSALPKTTPTLGTQVRGVVLKLARNTNAYAVSRKKLTLCCVVDRAANAGVCVAE